MFLRPGSSDLRLILYGLSRLVAALGAAMLVPTAWALLHGDWNSLSALGIGVGVAGVTGIVGNERLKTEQRMDWSHGLTTAALAWLVVPVFAAIPLILSGAYASPLDAVFDGLSGLTSSGITLIGDGDHLAAPLQLWRHALQLLGGQAFAVLALTILTVGTGQTGTLSLGEARSDRILPNAVAVTRFVVRVAATYSLVTLIGFTIANLLAGLRLGRAIEHAVLLVLSSFNTSGFAPLSSSVGFYHSPLVESVAIFAMLAGALGYGLHYAMWFRDPREVVRNLQGQIMALSLFGLTIAVLLGLGRSGTYGSAVPLLRKGVFTLVSAHTTTGLTVADPRLILTDWGQLAPAAIVGAMAAGGMAGSSAGGIKSLRIGLIAKGVIKDIRTVLLPESALVVETYHSGRRQILRDAPVTAAVSLLLLGLISIVGGGIIGLFAGADFTAAVFDSAAATSNSGISVGVINPGSAAGMKLMAMAQMWFGRLEYLAAFALIGYAFATVRGRT